MFKNIGKKIMVLTTVLCIIGLVLSLVAGFSVFYVLGDKINNIAVAISAGVLVALLYGLICWIGSFVTYGYGKLIDNTDKLVKTLEKIADKEEHKPTAEVKAAAEQNAQATWTCEKCGATISADLEECPICKIMEKPEDKE